MKLVGKTWHEVGATAYWAEYFVTQMDYKTQRRSVRATGEDCHPERSEGALSLSVVPDGVTNEGVPSPPSFGRSGNNQEVH
jgi:hypothetical protein